MDSPLGFETVLLHLLILVDVSQHAVLCWCASFLTLHRPFAGFECK